MKGGFSMNTKTYIIPDKILDEKEEKSLVALTDTYNKMIAPSAVNKAMKKVEEKVPQVVKDAFSAAGGAITEAELFAKSMELLGKSFQILEEYAAKISISENEIIKQVNQISADNQITTLDEICLIRSYELSKMRMCVRSRVQLGKLVHASGVHCHMQLALCLLLLTNPSALPSATSSPSSSQ